MNEQDLCHTPAEVQRARLASPSRTMSSAPSSSKGEATLIREVQVRPTAIRTMQFQDVQSQIAEVELILIFRDSVVARAWLAYQARKSIRGYRPAAVKAPERLWTILDEKSASDVVWLKQDCVASETYMLYVEETKRLYAGIINIITYLHQEFFENALVPCKVVKVTYLRETLNGRAGEILRSRGSADHSDWWREPSVVSAMATKAREAFGPIGRSC